MYDQRVADLEAQVARLTAEKQAAERERLEALRFMALHGVANTELRAQLAEARANALEEAAGAVLRFDNDGVAILRGDYAAAIRALKARP